MRHGFVSGHLAGPDLGPELVWGAVEGFRFPGAEAVDWELPLEIPAELLKGLAPHGCFAYAGRGGGSG